MKLHVIIFLRENLSAVIISNQYESEDIITNPEKVVNYGILIFWVILFATMILLLITVAKRIVK